MIKLSKRLDACASLVRQNTTLADVGCDHGYVPVYLVENGIITRAVASDINVQPLKSCENLVKSEGLEEIIKCVLSDGLNNIDGSEAEDILLAGMGGELIAEILSRCPYVKEKHIIINAMTHPELARQWLFENGFEIKNDLVVKDGRHYYSVLDAYYTGKNTEYKRADLYLGKIEDFSNTEYFVHLLNYLKNKEKGGADCADIICAIEEIIK